MAERISSLFKLCRRCRSLGRVFGAKTISCRLGTPWRALRNGLLRSRTSGVYRTLALAACPGSCASVRPRVYASPFLRHPVVCTSATVRQPACAVPACPDTPAARSSAPRAARMECQVGCTPKMPWPPCLLPSRTGEVRIPCIFLQIHSPLT